MAEKLTYAELLDKLKEQIELLQLSAENFDNGRTVTTLQMATTIRVLFHDTDSSKSLIKQICECCGKGKDDFEMVTTKDQDSGKKKLILLGDGLCSISMGPQGFTYIPKLDHAVHTRVPFINWWKENVIKNVSNGFENPAWMTREELIKLHTNKEGGAHVDNNKNKKITEIGTKEAEGWVGGVFDEAGGYQEKEAEINQKKATIRQICYEVLFSLYNQFPSLFQQKYF